MPCSAMMRAASWARARRKSSARYECFLGMVLKERFVAVVQMIRRRRAADRLRLGQAALHEFLHDAVRVIRTREQPRIRIDPHRDDSIGDGRLAPRRAGKRSARRAEM